MTHESDELFDFQDEGVDGTRRGRGGGWLTVLVALAGIVLTLVFGVWSLLAFERAGQLDEWSEHSMVVSGTYQTMTNDLVTKDYNGIYAGIMPENELLKGHKVDNGLNDPKEAKAGQQLTFRGTEVGRQDSDFPQAVDAILALEGDTLTVVDSGPQGSFGEGITDSTVNAQRVKAIGLGLVAVGVLAATVWGVRKVHRATR